MMAAIVTRSNTTVSGGNSRSTTPLKKNDPPHSTDSNASSDQSRASIRLSLAGICGSHLRESADAYRKSRRDDHPIPAGDKERRAGASTIRACFGLRSRILSSWVDSWSRTCGLMVRDARRCRAPHHEGFRPHPEEHREAMRLEG